MHGLDALIRREPRSYARGAGRVAALVLGTLVVLHACDAPAQERITDRQGRTTATTERLAGSQDQYRIIGRDGRTQGYVDRSSGRVTGRDGSTRGYVREQRR